MTEKTVTRIYRPLHELKYAYESHSKPTTVQADAVSSKLPTIKPKSRQHNEHTTRTLRYTNTVKETLKMKLECGHIYDQISLIDRHMKEESAKYEEARSKHERFAEAFHRFLGGQYERVKTLLAELADQERVSAEKKTTLEQLRQQATEKSLKIYELERQWRKHKSSQNFLLYLASLLKHDQLSAERYQTFGVDPACDTPSLDELIDNFERHAASDKPFDEIDFEHVTAERVFAYLGAVREQNLRLLDLKLRYESSKEQVEEEKLNMEREYESRAARIASEIEETKNKTDETTAEIERTKKELDELVPSEKEAEKLKAWRENVETLYKRCFGTSDVQGSHLQMMKCVEEHCIMLLSKLNTFDSRTLQKVTGI